MFKRLLGFTSKTKQDLSHQATLNSNASSRGTPHLSERNKPLKGSLNEVLGLLKEKTLINSNLRHTPNKITPKKGFLKKKSDKETIKISEKFNNSDLFRALGFLQAAPSPKHVLVADGSLESGVQFEWINPHRKFFPATQVEEQKLETKMNFALQALDKLLTHQFNFLNGTNSKDYDGQNAHWPVQTTQEGVNAKYQQAFKNLAEDLTQEVEEYIHTFSLDSENRDSLEILRLAREFEALPEKREAVGEFSTHGVEARISWMPSAEVASLSQEEKAEFDAKAMLANELLKKKEQKLKEIIEEERLAASKYVAKKMLFLTTQKLDAPRSGRSSSRSLQIRALENRLRQKIRDLNGQMKAREK
ncbi:hypothetical protein [Mycoavidus sp. B2-EB]|uniref:hypothetical protein n=1 Tax=Mycoavidus sp. B2-EB TaxID=2651972 RepID=UPI001626BD89|nr:hypothetical protein [Mycoavidus sp. B2-EB]BBO60466.1 hypothetical protein MPB2EB_1609 [Mycoavidus sp. B2-EB]